MEVPFWLYIIILVGGYSLLLIQQGIDVGKGMKYVGNEFHTKFTTSFVFGSLMVVAVTSILLYQYNDEDLFRYLILFGAIGGIALSMIQIQFSKIRLNFATAD